MTTDSLTVALLVGAAFVAGTFDAIAGGGGILTLPALMWAGLPAEVALGTNKGQSVFGSFSAMLRFGRSGLLDKPRARRTFPSALAGAAAGALLVVFGVPHKALMPVVLALLIGVAVFLLVRPSTLVPSGDPPRRPMVAAVTIGAVIGAYDGFFGPGTGTFAILVFVLWLKDRAAQASADAKVLNFASNLASVVVFSFCGLVRWDVAVPMAVAQFAGGALGAHLTVRRGDVLVRRVTPWVVGAVAVKVAIDLVRAWK